MEYSIGDRNYIRIGKRRVNLLDGVKTVLPVFCVPVINTRNTYHLLARDKEGHMHEVSVIKAIYTEIEIPTLQDVSNSITLFATTLERDGINE